MNVQRKLVVLIFATLIVTATLTSLQPAMATQSENKAPAGSKAPSFSVETLDGKAVSLDNFRGRVLLLEFFATWCRVCKDTTPEFKQVRENFSSENLAILSVESSPTVSLENVREFKSEYGGDWSFAKAPEVADRYGVEGYPTVFVIDPDGYIAFRSDGSVPPDVLNSIVGDLLRASETPENQAEVANVIIDVDVEPENAGGIVATSFEVKEDGTPLFTFRARPNSGYKFENWGGSGVPENRKNRQKLEIVPIPGTRITANFARVENLADESGEPSSWIPETTVFVSFALGAVIGASFGVLTERLVWGRKKTEQGD